AGATGHNPEEHLKPPYLRPQEAEENSLPGKTRWNQAMRVIQFEHATIGRCLGVVRGEQVDNITEHNPTLTSVYAAFRAARLTHRRLPDFLADILANRPESNPLNYADLLAAGRVRPLVSEEPGTRLLVSGTGLTHTGSVQQRDAMHQTTEPAGAK